MTVVLERATQTKLSTTECWRKRAEPAFAQLAEETRFYSGMSVYEIRWDEKTFARSGDLVAVAVLKTLDDSEMASPESAKLGTADNSLGVCLSSILCQSN